ncbi:hypothetical protein BU23DRAFT_49796 [Bimuria novae-zelandiae CBS 107.79]|uniref:Uncharacterized protein n=1 Tax=Bimuria novae-zelandiae CBS 107.79 TaxID=1447943 RepID=A0A6A5UJP7_9PLEO|nr:hypothetical protein BU23DRAFT_49796 [Bimuria novae-zelandiae CBS 107.79]
MDKKDLNRRRAVLLESVLAAGALSRASRGSCITQIPAGSPRPFGRRCSAPITRGGFRSWLMLMMDMVGTRSEYRGALLSFTCKAFHTLPANGLIEFFHGLLVALEASGVRRSVLVPKGLERICDGGRERAKPMAWTRALQASSRMTSRISRSIPSPSLLLASGPPSTAVLGVQSKGVGACEEDLLRRLPHVLFDLELRTLVLFIVALVERECVLDNNELCILVLLRSKDLLELLLVII